MATYFVASGGSNTAPYDTWAKAATSLATALAAATSAGDMVVIQYDGVPAGDAELAADTTYTFGADNLQLIASTNSGTATITPTAMGAANWIGNSTTNRSVTFSGAARKIFMYGITPRTAGATADSIAFVGDGASFTGEDCYLWQGNSGTSQIQIGASDQQVFARFVNCTLRFGGTSPRVVVSGRLLLEGGSVSSAGSAPANLFVANLTDPAGGLIEWIGGDLSHMGGSNLLSDSSTQATTLRLSQCRLGTFPPLLATQTHVNGSSGEIYAFDCATGDTHGLFAYVNPLGSVSSDTGIYFTSGAAAQSWKIVTTSAANFYTPFVTPWFGYWNTVTTAITPYVEILRDGSATAYQDDEVWLDVAAKTNSGSTQSALTTDRMALLGTPANQDAGAGLGSWTGEAGTAWSGKLAVASLTPAEVGRLSARVVVGEPSVTVYADPQVRT